MTATIKVGTRSSSTQRHDEQTRREDYAKGLDFWTQHPDARISGIVFSENSGADLSSLMQRTAVLESKRPIEWLQFDNNKRPESVHYGFSELGLIDSTIANSRLMMTERFFVKATGRLSFPRVSRVLDALEENMVVAVDMRNAYAHEKGIRARVRTQLMFFSREFYSENLFATRSEMIGNCSHIEEFLAQKLLPLRGEEGVVLRFPVECPAKGVGGAHGSNYSSVWNSCKSGIRSVSRKLTPWLWI